MRAWERCARTAATPRHSWPAEMGYRHLLGVKWSQVQILSARHRSEAISGSRNDQILTFDPHVWPTPALCCCWNSFADRRCRGLEEYDRGDRRGDNGRAADRMGAIAGLAAWSRLVRSQPGPLPPPQVRHGFHRICEPYARYVQDAGSKPLSLAVT